MTPLIRFALGLVAGGLAVKTFRNTVLKDKGMHRPSDASPVSAPAATNDSPVSASDKKRATTPAKKRNKPAAASTKTSA